MNHLDTAVPIQLRSFDEHPLDTLAGKTVTLSPLLESDAPDMLAYAGHRDVARTVTWDAHRDVDDSRAYIRDVRARRSVAEGRTFLSWAARQQGDGRVVGHVTFTEQGDIRGQIGYVFHYQHWRRRLPVESLRLAIGAIYSTLPRFERISALCLPAHVSSRDLLASVGLSFEGIQRAMLRVRGEIVDLAAYAITRSDWVHRRGGWEAGDALDLHDGHI
jgi:ribosomal-protein-alanine N-acetyltransferase